MDWGHCNTRNCVKGAPLGRLKATGFGETAQTQSCTEHGLHVSVKTVLCLVPFTAKLTESRISHPDLNKHSTCFGVEQTDCCQKTPCICLAVDLSTHSLTTHTQPKPSSEMNRRASCPQDFSGGSSGYYPFLGLVSDPISFYKFQS